ncbi:MAG: hypothetical protein GF405_01845 [Candidatus Eisenbacteria bacterium]|nr:hypothetical protein [Candidatus Eisenbacteria bacterium]
MTLTRGDGLRRVLFVAAVLALMLFWATAASGLCPRVDFVRVSDRSIAMGWTMDESEAEIEDFGGYRVWFREVWESDEFSLLSEYEFGEEDPDAASYWPFDPYYEQPVRSDSAAIFQNAFPYELSVTAFTASNPDSNDAECLEANRTGIIYPRVGVQDGLEEIECIPNPYRSSADWEYGGQRRVTFVGLPSRATIMIYTVALDHVRTLEHDDPGSDQEFWDLKSKDGDEVAPGVYLWHVEAEGLGTTDGRVMIIK